MTDYRTYPALRPHCDAGDAKILLVYNGGSCGKDWEIRCLCGHRKHYTWVGESFAVQSWNETEAKRDDE